MNTCFRNTRMVLASALMALASITSQAATITSDGVTISNNGVVYKSQFQGDVLMLSIFTDGTTGTLAGANSLKQLTFSSMRPAGPGNSGFFLNGATMTGSSNQAGLACNGSNGGGQICFFDMDDAFTPGAPLSYTIAFDYSGPAIDFDNFNLRALYTGQRLNAAGTRLVNFQASETVGMNAMEVPEPASLALVGAGIGLLGVSRRRKAKAQ